MEQTDKIKNLAESWGEVISEALSLPIYMVVRALEFQEKALVRAIKVFLKTDVDFLRKNRSFSVRKR